MTNNKTRAFLLQELYKLNKKSDFKVKNNIAAASCFQKWAYKKCEYFLLLSLDSQHRPIKIHEVSKGTLNRTLVHPREVFKEAIKDNASAVIVAHNHPSGDSTPSEDDKSIDKRMRNAGEILGIPVLDSIIIAAMNFYSFENQNFMTAESVTTYDYKIPVTRIK